MQDRKLNVYLAFFVYGGNGGIATCNPFLKSWYSRLLVSMKADPRIDRIGDYDFCDTPITMSRNRAVVEARKWGADVLIMVDSDNIPDLYLSRPGAKKFFDSSFDFLYKHWDRGPVAIAAPYCGPPSEELVYIFEWINSETTRTEGGFKLQMVSRTDSSRRAGIQEAAALPTGVTMWDMRIWELTEPKARGDRAWFEYEYEDIYQSKKCTTEDVFATREISMAGCVKLGYNPLFCNWDAWAGHVKQKIVGPPEVPTADVISETFKRAVLRDQRSDERLMMVGHDDPDWNPDEHPPMPRFPVVSTELYGHPFTRLGFCSPSSDYAALANVVRVNVSHRSAQMVEVGSWVGESAAAILSGAPRGSSLACVDTFTGNPKDGSYPIAQYFGRERLRETFRQNMKPYIDEKLARLIESDSLAAAAEFQDRSLDFVYIDAQHDYEHVKADIQAWLPKLKSTGILAGHDYCDDYPGVAQAAHEIFGQLVTVAECSPVWWVNVAAHRRSEAAKNGRKECQASP